MSPLLIKGNASSLLANYLMKHMTHLNDTFGKYLLGAHLRLINFYSQLDSRWPPQAAEFRKHKQCYVSVDFYKKMSWCGVVVAKSHPQHTFLSTVCCAGSCQPYFSVSTTYWPWTIAQIWLKLTKSDHQMNINNSFTISSWPIIISQHKNVSNNLVCRQLHFDVVVAESFSQHNLSTNTTARLHNVVWDGAKQLQISLTLCFLSMISV